MLDVGANVDCKPHNLQQFAIMGEIYFRSIFADAFPRPSHPRVGLLSVGEEETKGNDLTREAFQLHQARCRSIFSAMSKAATSTTAAPTSSSATASWATWR